MPRTPEYVYLLLTKAGGVEGVFADFTTADDFFSRKHRFMDQDEWDEYLPGRWRKRFNFRNEIVEIQRQPVRTKSV